MDELALKQTPSQVMPHSRMTLLYLCSNSHDGTDRTFWVRLSRSQFLVKELLQAFFVISFVSVWMVCIFTLQHSLYGWWSEYLGASGPQFLGAMLTVHLVWPCVFCCKTERGGTLSEETKQLLSSWYDSNVSESVDVVIHFTPQGNAAYVTGSLCVSLCWKATRSTSLCYICCELLYWRVTAVS